MEILSDKKINLLYVGENKGVEEQFQNCSTKVDFHQVKNSVLAIKWLEENEGVDAILCEKQIQGQTGIYFHKVLRKRLANNESIPFILIYN